MPSDSNELLKVIALIDPTQTSDETVIDAERIALSSTKIQSKTSLNDQVDSQSRSPSETSLEPARSQDPQFGQSSNAASTGKQLSWMMRILSMTSGIVLLALLVIARGLDPSPTGFGTHQQLGLPPCTAIVLLNIPCPACGMTTSWAHTTRGNLVAAAQCNAGGMLLAVIAMAFLPASCYFFFRGRASTDGWFSLVLAICLVAALGLSLVQWAIRLLN